MKKFLKSLIPALIVGFALFPIAHAQVSNPQWKINAPSSTITPINSSLQVPCANIVGGCSSGGGISPTSTNTFTVPQNFNGISNTGNVNSTNFTATASSTQSYFANIDSYQYAATTTPAGFSDYNAYLNQLCSQVASGTTINLPQGNFNVSTTLNITQHCTFQGVGGGGTVLTWTGAQGGTMINQNWGLLPHVEGGGLKNLTLNGGNTTTTNPTTCLLEGGLNGASHSDDDGLTITNCGTGLKSASNTYMTVLANTTIVLNGRNLWIATSSNSGESLDFVNVKSLDCANATTTKCDYFGTNSVENGTWVGGAVDDVQSYYENGVNLSYYGVNNENPGYATYGKYDYHVLADSFYGTTVSWYGGNFQNDSPATSTAPTEFVNGGGIAEFYGTQVSKGSGSAAIVPELFNNGINSVDGIGYACGVINQNNSGNALTSIFPAGNTTNAENWGCLAYIQNNYIQGVDYTSGNTNFYHGGGIKGVLANNGWNLGGAIAPTTTVQVTGSLGTNFTVGAVSSTLSVTSPAFQVFTGSGAATATLPSVSVSQGQIISFKNRGTATLSISRAGSDFIWQSGVNASATAYALTAGSSTAFQNDGTYWDQLWK